MVQYLGSIIEIPIRNHGILRFCHDGPEGAIICHGFQTSLTVFNYSGETQTTIRLTQHSKDVGFIKASCTVGKELVLLGVKNRLYFWDLKNQKCSPCLRFAADIKLIATQKHQRKIIVCAGNQIHFLDLFNRQTAE